ncbi:hypothetical protein A9Q94_17005 [Rhodobacterales bacterium 56_14_T64]|nr:hypothetical protein A9Q94_17005 [Rhodobacterales bacterium 56_14_T64]
MASTWVPLLEGALAKSVSGLRAPCAALTPLMWEKGRDGEMVLRPSVGLAFGRGPQGVLGAQRVALGQGITGHTGNDVADRFGLVCRGQMLSRSTVWPRSAFMICQDV